MEGEITLDRETFKALAAETRISVLKALGRKRMTGAELAKEVRLSPSTVKEHLDQLVRAGLIEPVDDGRKWKYYLLTYKGRQVIVPDRPQGRVWIALGVAVLALAFSTYSIFDVYSQQQAAVAPAASPLSIEAAYGQNAINPADQPKDAAPLRVGPMAAQSQVLVEEAPPSPPALDLPTGRQLGFVDLAIEASLIVIALGLGYYALKSPKGKGRSLPA